MGEQISSSLQLAVEKLKQVRENVLVCSAEAYRYNINKVNYMSIEDINRDMKIRLK